MASLFTTGKGRPPPRAIQFKDTEGNRRTLRIGKCHLPDAEAFRRRIGQLESRANTGVPLNRDLALWLDELPAVMYAKLGDYGLVEPRERLKAEAAAPGLCEWLAKYIEQRSCELGAASIEKMERVRTLLVEHFGPRLPLADITPEAAHDWQYTLRQRGDMREATIRTHCRYAKQMFAAAEKRRVIDGNPFADLKASVIEADRLRYVTEAEALRVIEFLPTIDWKLLFGLARFAALRTPSETHGLEWKHVDFDVGKLKVYAPKTDRWRYVPIHHELQALLLKALEDAPEGAQRILRLSRNNLHRQVNAAIRAAEIAPWPKLFQALRQSCETWWVKTQPGYVAAAWAGHSEAVSRKHYQIESAMITDAHYRAACEQTELRALRQGSASERKLRSVTGSVGDAQ